MKMSSGILRVPKRMKHNRLIAILLFLAAWPMMVHAATLGPGLHIHNRTRLDLDYTLLPGSIGVVCYYTSDGGTNWLESSGTDQPPGSANTAGIYNFSAPGDGTYGLILQSRFPEISTKPPAPYALPDLTVIIDSKAPAVFLESQFSEGTEPDAASVQLILKWRVEDANLKSGSGVIEQQAMESDQWVLVAESLPKEGEHTLPLPEESSGKIVAFRLSYKDLAGNQGIKEIWREYPVQEPKIVEVPKEEEKEVKEEIVVEAVEAEDKKKEEKEKEAASKQMDEEMEEIAKKIRVLSLPDAGPNPKIRIYSQKINLAYGGGKPFEIRWRVEDFGIPIVKTEILFSSNKINDEWETIYEANESLDHYEWILPKITKDTCFFKIRATDAQGHIGETTNLIPFAIDSSPPEAWIVDKKRDRSGKIVLKIRGRDKGMSGIRAIKIWGSMDQQTWQEYCTARFPYDAVVLEATDGAYYLIATAIDAVGNAEPAPLPGDKEELHLVMDGQPPKIRFTKVERILDEGQIPHMRLEWEASDANLSEQPVTLSYSMDYGANWVILKEGGTPFGHLDWRIPPGSQKQVIFRAVALDKYGNQHEALSGDLLNPDIRPLQAVITGPTTANTHNIPLQVTYPNGQDEIASMDLWYREAGTATWEKNGHFRPNSEVVFKAKDGKYELFLTLEDTSGQKTSKPSAGEAVSSILIDTMPPLIQIKQPKQNLWRGGQLYPLAWSIEEKNPGVADVLIELSLEKDIWLPTATVKTNQLSYDIKLPITNSNKCRMRVSYKDAAGNLGHAVTLAGVNVDAERPMVRIKGPARSSYKLINLKLDVTDPGGSGIEKVVIWGREDGHMGRWKKLLEKAYDAAPFEITLDDGVYQLVAQGVDKAGNREPSPEIDDPAELLLKVKSHAGTVKLTSMTGGEVISGGHPVEIAWQTQDLNQQEAQVTIFLSTDNGATWQPLASSIDDTSHYLWHVPRINTPEAMIKVQVKDSFNNEIETVSGSAFVIDSTPPSLFANPAIEVGAKPDTRVIVTENTKPPVVDTAKTVVQPKVSDQSVMKQVNELPKLVLPLTENNQPLESAGDDPKVGMPIREFLNMKITNDMSDYHFNMGYAYYRYGKYTSAMNDLEKAIKINPDRIECYPIIADIYDRTNKKDLAREYYELTIRAYGKESEMGHKAATRLENLQ